jgi:hypothetical protein
MAKVSESEFLEAFERGISTGGEKFKKGVERSKDWEAAYTSPSAQAAMEEGLRRAIAEGKPAAGAREKGTAGWRADTTAKAGNYTGSAKRARSNMAPVASKILAAGDRASAAAAAVTGPKDRATAKAKAAAAIDAIMDEWGK